MHPLCHRKRLLRAGKGTSVSPCYVVNKWQRGGALAEETIDLVSTYATGVLMMPGASERCLPLMLRAFAASRTPIGPIVETLSVPVTFIYGENDWMTPANGVEAGA